MSHWPKHTDGHRRWKALEDQIEAERRGAFAAGVGELQASWRERERVRAAPETGEGVPWWRKLRLFRPAMATR